LLSSTSAVLLTLRSHDDHYEHVLLPSE